MSEQATTNGNVPTASTSAYYEDKSEGHIGFTPTFEYYWGANGDLYRANRHNPVMPDGRRAGRWEASKPTAAYFLKMAGLGAEEKEEASQA
jgi:hypothetical protein